MAAEELLEVEDRERVTLVERQELAERGVSLDRLLVHQVVGARVRHHTLRNCRAADLGVLGLTQEGRELVADLHGLREDAGLRLGTLNGLRLALTAAIGLLDNTRGLLLNALECSGSGRRGGLEGAELLVELRDRLLKRSTDVLLDDGVRGRGGNHRRGGDNRRNLNGSLRGLGGLRGLRGLGDNGCCLNGGSGNGRGGNGGLGVLGRLRGGGLGRGGAHFGSVGGSICGHLTRVLATGEVMCGRQVWGPNHKSCRPQPPKRMTFVLKNNDINRDEDILRKYSCKGRSGRKVYEPASSWNGLVRQT